VASSDVHAIAIQSLTFHNDIAQVDANAKAHLAMFWKLCILHLQYVLDFNSTAYRIDHTGELRQQVIAGRIDDTTTMVMDARSWSI
jgi:hypothetical protein